MELPAYLVIDIETTVKNDPRHSGLVVGTHQASPYHYLNEIVAVGYKTTAAYASQYMLKSYDFVPALENYLVVGHNIKFDLLYLIRDYPQWREWLKSSEALIWDTQLVEYLLSGQLSTLRSLDTLAAKYGLTLKSLKLSAYYDAGLDTTDIPQDKLMEYLHGDVTTTEEIFKRQYEAVIKKGMMPLVQLNMQALIALIEMEYNGMYTDADFFNKLAATYTEIRDNVTYKIEDEMLRLLGVDSVNPGSNDQISLCLFGGQVKTIADIAIKDPETGIEVRYKTGNRKGEVKTKKEFVLKSVTGYGVKPLKSWEREAKKGFYKVDDGVLGAIADYKYQNKEAAEFCKLVLEYRAVNKQLTTYAEGYTALRWPDDYIHPTFQTTVTRTGRYSCTAPNLQNTTRTGDGANVKEAFTTRFGDDGLLVECDLRQIEVVAQAILSNDQNMKQAIRDGVDFHVMRLAYKLGKSYDEVFQKCKVEKDAVYGSMRTASKQVSFQKAYGASAFAISASTGLDIEEVKQFMDAEDAMFPGVPAYQNRCIEAVERNAMLSRYRTESGLPARLSYLIEACGKRYVFIEEDRRQWGNNMPIASFKPTRIKNFPIQGFSAEILKAWIVSIRHAILKSSSLTSNIYIINTVHDNILFDCRRSYVEDLIAIINEVTEDLPNILNRLFDMNIDVPIQCDIGVGENWAKCK